MCKHFKVKLPNIDPILSAIQGGIGWKRVGTRRIN